MKKKIAILSIIFLVIIFYLYNFKYGKMLLSSNANELYKVNLEENNCDILIENNITTIQKYNGNADTVVIDKNTLSGEFLIIDSKAFLECSNLEKILIEKDFISEEINIENFEINTDYNDEKYVEYKNIQDFSEAYKKYELLSEDEKNKIAIVPDKYDISLSVLNTESMQKNYNLNEELHVPEKFSLKDKIKIKAEHQGNYNICYAFASLTSVETNLALRHNDYVDLSEHHLANNTYGFRAGGAFINSDNKYYKEKLGPIYENEWNGTNSPDIVAKRYIKETVNLPTINKSIAYTQDDIQTIRKIIKTHIMQYGSLYVSISSKVKENDGMYVLNSESSNYPDHAVSLIGWDDNFSKENFPIGNRPNSDGAYLAMNSWGETWGNNGCFWISYEDYWVEASLKGVIAVDTCQEKINIENVTITDKDSNTEIPYQIQKGINAQIEINANIKEIIGGQEQLGINVISQEGENITNKIKVSENKIENNKAKILLNLKTSELSTGEYIINLNYDNETIAIPIIIKIDTFDFKIKEDGNINITGYYGNDKKIIIPKEYFGFSVTGIENQAFINNNLDSITIYENITEIGENIIDKSVIIYGNKDTYIEQYANENDYIFVDLNKECVDGQGWFFDIENNKLYIIENSTAKEYDYLKNLIYKVELNESITEIFDSQFYGYKNLKEVILPDSIISIGPNSFGECDNLKTIKLPSQITKIESKVFYNCIKLESIDIPNGVTSIGNEVFYGCTNLKNINIPNSLKTIGSETFLNCINLENINIPEGVTDIGNRAFYRCTSLKDLDIPSTITSIGDNVFYGCIINQVIEHGITEAELPNIIKRAITKEDILNCGSGISIINAQINSANKLELTPGYGEIIITISSGKLTGLKISLIASGVIEYSDYDWTSEDVTAILYIGKDEKVINNNGDTVYKFTENGEFEFEYIDLNGENKKVIAKVENIDKTLPEVKTIINKNEQGFIENITAHISDYQAGLWSKTSIGYAWSTSNVNKPQDWIMVDLPDFSDGTQETSFDINISDLSGKYYLWFYKNAVYDMVSNGFEKVTELMSSEPYYLGTEPILKQIIIVEPPNKTTYIEGENFETEGMKIIEKYHNGTEVEIKEYELINGDNLTSNMTYVTISYNKGDEVYIVTQDIKVEAKLEVNSETYDIQESYISNIKTNVTIEKFKEQIDVTIGDINFYDKNDILQDNTQILSTGMKLKIKSERQEKELTIIVHGDSNGDGKADLRDILAINKHRLNKANLTGEYLLAGDINKDGKADIRDILQINKFRLGKIELLI